MPFPAIKRQIKEIEQEKFQLELRLASLKFQMEQDDKRISDYINNNSLGFVIAEQTIVDLYANIESYLASDVNSLEAKIVELFVTARNILLIKILIDLKEKYEGGIEISDLTETRMLKLNPFFYEITSDNDILECRSYYEDLILLAVEMLEHRIIQLAADCGVRIPPNQIIDSFLINATREKSSYKDLVLAVRKVVKPQAKNSNTSSYAKPSAEYLEVVQSNTIKLHHYIAEANLQLVKDLITKFDMAVQQHTVIQAIKALDKRANYGIALDKSKAVLKYIVDEYYSYDPNPDFCPLKTAIMAACKVAIVEFQSYDYQDLKISKQSLIDSMKSLEDHEKTRRYNYAKEVLVYILDSYYIQEPHSDFNPIKHAIMSHNISALSVFKTYENPNLRLHKDIIQSFSTVKPSADMVSKHFSMHLQRLLKQYIQNENYKAILSLMTEYSGQVPVTEEMAIDAISLIGDFYEESSYDAVKAGIVSLLNAYAVGQSQPEKVKSELILPYISVDNEPSFVKLIFEVSNILQRPDLQDGMLSNAFFNGSLDEFIFYLKSGVTWMPNTTEETTIPQTIILNSINSSSQMESAGSVTDDEQDKRQRMRTSINFLNALVQHDMKSSIFITPVSKQSLLKVSIAIAAYVDFEDVEIRNGYTSMLNLLLNSKLQLEDDVLKWAFTHVNNRKILIFIMDSVSKLVDTVVFSTMLRCIGPESCPLIDKLMYEAKEKRDQGNALELEVINMKIKLLIERGQKINPGGVIVINDFEYVGMAIRHKISTVFNNIIATINSLNKFKFVYDRIDNLSLRNGDEINPETNSFIDQIMIPYDHLLKILCSSYGYALKNKALNTLDALTKQQKQLMKNNGDFEKIKQSFDQSNPNDMKLSKRLKTLEKNLVESGHPKAVLFSREEESDPSVSSLPVHAHAKPKIF